VRSDNLAIRDDEHIVPAQVDGISIRQAAREFGLSRQDDPKDAGVFEERRKLQKRRWFKKGQTWRIGCEGRISTVKRRHGLARCRYHGTSGMQRWVGLGVIADNLINLGKHLAPTLA
jgi:IS5 family transposase